VFLGHGFPSLVWKKADAGKHRPTCAKLLATQVAYAIVDPEDNLWENRDDNEGGGEGGCGAGMRDSIQSERKGVRHELGA
jgi:hypothetical protein